MISSKLFLLLHTTILRAEAFKALRSADMPVKDAGSLLEKDLKHVTKLLQNTTKPKIEVPAPKLHKKTPKPITRVIEEVARNIVLHPDYTADPALRVQEVIGCKTLLLEIVRRAAYDWVLYRTSRRLLHKKLAEDAYLWLFVEEPEHPNAIERDRAGKSITSFLTICNELDIDAATVRKYVKKLTIKNVMSVGRPAEYRRRETSPISMGEEHIAAISASSMRGIESSYEDTGSISDDQ